jgi:hypothetical protein
MQLAAASPEIREAVAWLAGCLDDPSPAVREHVVTVAEDDRAPLTVEATALHVDRGRALAAAPGITVLVAAGEPSPGTDRLAAWLAREEEQDRPLGALRRLGDAHAAVLTGLALGAGEQGLALICDGPAATACAALAVAIEPALRLRVLAVDAHADAVVSVLRVATAAAR